MRIFIMKYFTKKRVKILTLISFSIILIFLMFFLRTIPSFGIKFSENMQLVNYLSISEEIFLRQTFNNCAPYSVMGVINVLKGDIIDPEKLAQETRWRLIKNLTFPQGLIDLLHKYNIKTREYSMKIYTDGEKIIWLKNQIDNGTPIILLVKVNNIQHYFTIIGYDENGFMLYDSLQERLDESTRKTVIDKEEYIGNRYYRNEEIINFWNNGGYKVFFRNWVIVCYK